MLKVMLVTYLACGDMEASLFDTQGNRILMTDLAEADTAVMQALKNVGRLAEVHTNLRPDVLREEVYLFS